MVQSSKQKSTEIQMCMKKKSYKFLLYSLDEVWPRLKDGGRERKFKASVLQMMKPPYNALQDVKVLCVKFMSA